MHDEGQNDRMTERPNEYYNPLVHACHGLMRTW